MFENKSLLGLVLGGLAVSLLSLMIWMFVNDSDSRMVFGKIMTVADNTIVVYDRHRRPHTIAITPETRLYNRDTRIDVNDVAIGQFVHIKGQLQPDTTITATIIRLLKPPKETSTHEDTR